jgi:hypothetical protein
MSRLYHIVDFELSQNRKPVFREPVTESVRELTIRNGREKRRNSIYKRRRVSDAGSVAGRVSGFLEKIPEQQLTRFEYASRLL